MVLTKLYGLFEGHLADQMDRGCIKQARLSTTRLPRWAKKGVLVAEQKDSCVKPARGLILPSAETAAPAGPVTSLEVRKMQARVGKPAPDFEANAFVGEGFKPIKLSDYKGKWVVLCFYPGDFTFV